AELTRVLGSILCVQGKYAEAEKMFAAGQDDRSEWRSNRAMALVGLGKLDDAKTEFQTCLDKDPLNLLDPLFGLGDVAQRKNDIPAANGWFETALHRAPDQPWILLRLGTVRLRDGLADKALQLGTHL